MPLHPGILLSVLLLVTCLGINAAHYPSVRKMLENQDIDGHSASTEAFRPVQSLPDETTPTMKTSNVNRPIPMETAPVSEESKKLKKTEVPEKSAKSAQNTKPELATKSEPKPEAKPAAKPEPVVKPEPKPEPKPVAKPEPKLVVKPEPKPVVMPEPKPVVKPEPKLVAKPAAAPEKNVPSAKPSFDAFAPIVPQSIPSNDLRSAPLPQNPQVNSAKTQSENKIFPAKTDSPAPVYAAKVEMLPDPAAPKTELKPLESRKKLRPLPPDETIDMILERPVMYEVLPLPSVPARS